ncbi:nuclease-related domain-containing protein [Cryobacterium sp. CG_9.6]|uniref:nuclease-related domain-containing protein n=1 Tax=Cryobacterium sp. CG_9.6 TaxID=2760710 RepID=UPI0024756911|nr:nuclease-related domain-containing protein [Cryobacterium sp. CG_9.6]MDH6236333.1 hypothetical protein [Cryobacterium sp. CG_9.6]
MMLDAPRMGAQVAAQSVIEELFRHQAVTPDRTAFARLFGYSPLGPDSASWYVGAKGEIEVGRLLAMLPPEWTVFHALPIGTKGSDIDHLVIGPGGIVTINTKNHSGKRIWVGERIVMVSGQKQPYIRNAEYEADRVTSLLRQRMPQLPAVNPAIALVSPKSVTVKQHPVRVKVLVATGLRRWLVKLPVVLNPTELVELAAIIDDPSTWPPPPVPPTENLMGRFATLDRQVRSARVRRTGWKVAAFVGILGGFVLVGPQVSAALLDMMTSGLR